MADKKISEFNSATLPLAGTEQIPIVQSGETKKIDVSDLGGSSLKSDFLEISPQIGFTITNGNWWGTANNFYTKYGVRIGSLGSGVVDTNAFADHIENFAYSTLVPYKCKVVSVLFNWFNNGASGDVEFKLRNYENDFTGTDTNGNNSVGVNNQIVASSGSIATASGYYHKNIIDNTSGVDATKILPKNSNLRLYIKRGAGSGNLPFQKFNVWIVIQEIE